MKVKASKYLLSKVTIVKKDPFIISSSVSLATLPDELRANADFFIEGTEVADDFFDTFTNIDEKFIEVIDGSSK